MVAISEPTLRGAARNDLAPALVAAIIALLGIQAYAVLSGIAPVLDGWLADPDAYMRLNRIHHIWTSGDWWSPVYTRIGPPDGLAQHWTLPLDFLLIAGALLASPVAGFADGLHWWGVLVSPLLLVLSLLVFVWAGAPLLRRDLLWPLGFLFMAQPGIVNYALVGRPDHHSLILLLYVWTIGLTIRLLLDPSRTRLALWSGLAAALALWVSVETVTVVALSLAAFGLFWLSGERWLVRVAQIHSGAVTAGIAVALLIERGVAQYAAVEFDRLSIAHCTLFGLCFVFWTASRYADDVGLLEGGFGRRVGWTMAAGAALGAALWLTQPGLFDSPFAAVDSLYRRVRLANIVEFQPLIGGAPDGGWTWDDSLARPVAWLGIAIPGIPWLLYLLRRRAAERPAWIYVALGILLFVPLTLKQIRWASYAEVLLLLPYAALVGSVVAALSGRVAGWLLQLVRPVVVVALCGWMFLPSMLGGSPVPAPGAAGGKPAAVAGCPLQAMAAYLADPAGQGAMPRHLLAFVDFGPELLYRTPHTVMAIPNHRLQPGFTASYRIMTATDFAIAASLLRGGAVDLLLICLGSPEDSLYRIDSDRPTLYRSLAAGDTPAFLEPVPLSAALAPFLLFAVRPPA